MIASRQTSVRDRHSPEDIDTTIRDQQQELLEELTGGKYDEHFADDSNDASGMMLRAPLPAYRHAVRRVSLTLNVKTSDLGPDRGEVVTEVMHEGAVVAVRRASYECEETEDGILLLMKTQHKSTLQKVRRGGFDPRLPLEQMTFAPPPGPG